MSHLADARRYARELRRRGWSVGFTGSGHYQAVHESGEVVTFAKSPSCHRWKKNTESRVRRVERG